jgi:hypothetical protein
LALSLAQITVPHIAAPQGRERTRTVSLGLRQMPTERSAGFAV